MKNLSTEIQKINLDIRKDLFKNNDDGLPSGAMSARNLRSSMQVRGDGFFKDMSAGKQPGPVGQFTPNPDDGDFDT